MTTNLWKAAKWLPVLTMMAGAQLATAQAVDSVHANVVTQVQMDSAFARARRLVMSGQTTAGRQMADSILAATPVGTPAYGSALYGRATLAATAADAERDYQRIVVEYPLSAHSGDALLALVQIERSNGDRAAAIGHLQRFLREDPGSVSRGNAAFWLAQLLFEQNNDADACGALDTARTALKAGDVELRNQLNFYSTRCQAVAARAAADSTAHADSVARTDSMARADSAKKASARERSRPREETAKKHVPAPVSTAPSPHAEGANEHGRYSVQVAAYGTESEARKAVERLHARGIEARVDGTERPYRVRIGRYTTRTEATEALARFKKLGIDGFVTTGEAR